MNVYMLPLGEDKLKDGLFRDREDTFWPMLVEAGKSRDITFHTIDLFNPENIRDEDVLLVLDHPEEDPIWRLAYFIKYWKTKGGFFWEKRRLLYHYRKFFKKQVLLQLGPPLISSAYKNLAKLRKLYTKVYFPVSGLGPEFGYFHYIYDDYYRKEEMLKKYFHSPRTKFLAMIASNCLPHSFRGDLYGERVRAITYWSRFPDFDLYGRRWDALSKHPAGWFSGAAIKHAWRGESRDRWADMSHYKFVGIYEAGAYPGWITEKIFDCFMTGAVPVYLGAPDIRQYIPGDCFINIADFPSYQALNDFLRGLKDDDIEKYRSAIWSFLHSGKDRPFTKEIFIEQLLGMVS